MPRPNREQQPEQPTADEVSSFDLPKDSEGDTDLPEDFGTPIPTSQTEDDAEDLSGFSINHDVTEEDRSRLLPPTGDYAKRGNQPWNYKRTFNELDKEPGDLSKKGRLIITMNGPIENEEYSGSIVFSMSPDRRFRVDFHTKEVDKTAFDGRYKLWLQALDYYELVVEEAAEKVEEVINLLSRDETVIFRIVKFGSGSDARSNVMGFKQ